MQFLDKNFPFFMPVLSRQLNSLIPFYSIHLIQKENMTKSLKNFFFVSIMTAIVVMTWGCDDIPDGTVEAFHYDNTVIEMSAPDSFNLTQEDSTFVVSIQFPENPFKRNVYVEVATVAGLNISEEQFQLKDDGSEQSGDETADDNVYTGIIKLSSILPPANYLINFFLEDQEQVTRLVASKQFLFSSGTVNYPPVLSNLQLPASVKRDESFVFTVKADDPNGLDDIARVYFALFRPDGTQSGDGAYFQMVDNGDDEHFGDATAKDGVYSYKNSFGASSAVGSWRFEFEAFDKSGVLSNKIIQTMEVEL